VRRGVDITVVRVTIIVVIVLSTVFFCFHVQRKVHINCNDSLLGGGLEMFVVCEYYLYVQGI